jgi:flagellar assembly factor FliW
MLIDTKPFGKIEIEEKQKIKIPEGLFGFETQQDFALLDAAQEPFYWLQSLDTVDVCFALIDPFVFRIDYEFEADDEDLKRIGIDSPQKIMVLAIVTIPNDGNPMTANLKGPLVINRENHQAMQVVLADNKWQTKHDILREMETPSQSRRGK